jgi:hypothetical protein
VQVFILSNKWTEMLIYAQNLKLEILNLL